MTAVSKAERMVLAMSHVPGFTKACATHGDAATFETLQAYYTVAADMAKSAGGQFIKPIGDGVLLAFPVERAAAAVQSLREFQVRASVLWRAFDDRCHVQVKVGVGVVQHGLMGAPGAERPDLVGDALNAFFRTPFSDFAVSADVATLLG
jgi:class 3 adenylate cyclase